MPELPDVATHQATLYASRNPTRRFLHNIRRDWITGALDRVCAGGKLSALDVGVGSGLYLAELGRRCRAVTGFDLDGRYLEAAQARDRHLRLVRGRIQQIPFAGESFDLVLFSEVVEHLTGDELAFAEIARVLRLGGAAIVTTPQRYSTMELSARAMLSPAMIRLTRMVYREPVLPLGHINLMTAGRLRAKLAAAGFVIQETAKFGLYLPLLAELGGTLAVRIADRLDRALRGTFADHLLWTQCYIARRAV